jgi:hypothetical protein
MSSRIIKRGTQTRHLTGNYFVRGPFQHRRFGRLFVQLVWRELQLTTPKLRWSIRPSSRATRGALHAHAETTDGHGARARARTRTSQGCCTHTLTREEAHCAASTDVWFACWLEPSSTHVPGCLTGVTQRPAYASHARLTAARQTTHCSTLTARLAPRSRHHALMLVPRSCTTVRRPTMKRWSPA